MKYIVQSQSGASPHILREQEDGTYVTITYGAGEKSAAALLELVLAANLYEQGRGE